jgi:hypothetical protein
VPGRQLPYTPEDRAIARRIEKRQIVIEGFDVDRSVHDARRDQRFEFGSEVEAIAVFGVVEWFDPGAISREDQGPGTAVPEGDAEHAAQPGETVVAPLLVGVDDRLGIAGRIEPVTERFELLSELAVIVDFAVEDDPGRLVFAMDRLMPGRQIDDAQPAHPETCPGLDVDPLVVRATMPYDLAHPVNEREV